MPKSKRGTGPTEKKTRQKKGKTAILLQGGASRGAHQVGAMKYLDEMGIRPDIVIGSSIGVINACLYASGGIERMVEFWTSFRTHPLIPGVSLRENVAVGNSLLSMRKNFERIESYFDFRKILRSRIETCFTLTNLSTGTAELKSNRTEKTVEDLRTISRIGYTIPGLYPPIEFQGDYWCDGGFTWSVPLECAFQRGATRVFMLLCIQRDLPRREKFGSIYQVLSRFYDIMWVHVGSAGILERDLAHHLYRGAELHIVEPSTDLEGYGPLNLLTFHPSKAERFIEQGYRDAQEQIEGL